MLISTMNDLPGHTVDEVLGEVFGLTVRSRNASELGSTWTAICAHGTAVKVTRAS